MKIVKIIEENIEEPYPCNACRDEWNGSNFIRVNLAKGFSVNLSICNDCLEDLRKITNTGNINENKK